MTAIDDLSGHQFHRAFDYRRGKQRGELSATEAAVIRSEFQKILDESFHVMLPTAADFDAARSFLNIPKTGPRAGDALHLAIAANRRARKIWSLDQGFIKAGKQLNLPVSAG